MSNLSYEEFESLNGIVLPKRTMERLNESANYFGDSMRDMFLNSIENNLSSLDENERIQVLKEFNENSLQINQLDASQKIINESSFIAPETFLTKLANANPEYLSKYNIVTEADTESIEGDGDEPDTGEEQPQEEEVPQEEVPADIDPEQLLQLELNQSNTKFITIVLYDKIVDLLGSIKTIKENMSSTKTEEELDIFNKLEKYEILLENLNELIFVMDINTIYYNVINIIIEVNDLLNRYLIMTKLKVVNGKKSSQAEKKEALDDLRQNNIDDDETNEEVQELSDEKE